MFHSDGNSPLVTKKSLTPSLPKLAQVSRCWRPCQWVHHPEVNNVNQTSPCKTTMNKNDGDEDDRKNLGISRTGTPRAFGTCQVERAAKKIKDFWWPSNFWEKPSIFQVWGFWVSFNVITSTTPWKPPYACSANPPPNVHPPGIRPY